ncbi:MAG: cation transporter [Chlamydiia bacterium]|nr:cation transporter [Chlamydiia bacterium]
MSCHFDLKCFQEKDDKQTRKLKIATCIALFFMLLELARGILANSLALISDALHMFTDVGAFLLSLIVLKIAKRPSTKQMTFGYQRAEILGALASALTLWALSFVLIYEGINRLITPHKVEGGIVFIIASLGLLSNLLMMKILHTHDPEEQLNVKAAYIHVLGDLLGSIGVITSGILIYFTGWNSVDPLISLIFALIILFTSGKILRKTLFILMEGAPEEVDWEGLRKDLLSLPTIKEVHDLHIWSLSSKQIALSAHIVAEKNILKEAQNLIYNKYNIHHITLQIDKEEEFEAKYCFDVLNSSL